MQKLLTPALASAWIDQGGNLLTGAVIRLSDASTLDTPAKLFNAYGIDRAPAAFVDVLRFPSYDVMNLRTPAPGDAATRAGFGAGFLRGAPIPVWDVPPTTVPIGSEVWRIDADGRQSVLTAYDGPAWGWRGTGVFESPTNPTLGPRAVWQGQELMAAPTPSARVALVTTGREPIEGFTESRPGVYTREVALVECSRLFEVELSARWQGVPCHVVYGGSDVVRVILDVDDAAAAAYGATVLEPGVSLMNVLAAELTDPAGVEFDVPTR